MNPSRRTLSLLRPILLAGLVALAGAASAQPDQRQFTADKPLPPFPERAPRTSASEPAAADAAAAVAAPGSAREWLSLQAGGTAASSEPRPMPGEVADAVYERYLNSFKHPIPEQFRRQSSGSDSGGQGGSGSGSGSR